MKTYLYWSKIAPLSPAEVQEQLRLIPYEKQLRLQKMHNQEQRIVSLWAERLLRYGLQKSYHLNIEEKNRKLTPEGKPYFSDNEIYFSLSHSGPYALAALSKVPVGADIQRGRDADMAAIARRLFAPQEYEVWQAVKNEREQKQLFYQIWTCKESEGKRRGCGLRKELPSCILPDGSLNPRYFFCKREENIFIATCTETKINVELQYTDFTKIQ